MLIPLFFVPGLKLYEGTAEDGRHKYRFISIAQDLVMAARGKLVERNWKRSDGTAATIDDISAFAIPILPFKEEYLAWIESRKVSPSSLPKPDPSSSCDVTSVVVDSHEAMTNGASLNESVLSPGAASGVQDVSMEDVAIAEEAVEQDDDDDDVVDDDDEAQK